MKAAACTEEVIDGLLAKIEATLLKIEAAKGSSVKLAMLETNLLTVDEKVRDSMVALIQDSEDKDRKKMIAIFGGDCVRIARMRAYLEAATKLSEKTAKDQRIAMCLQNCEIIESVLIEKGLGGRLREARERFSPGDAHPFEAEKPVRAPKSEPEPCGYNIYVGETSPEEPPPAPEPKPEPKPEPEPEMKLEPTPEPPTEASERRRRSKTGSVSSVESANNPRKVIVSVTGELQPSFNYGEDDIMVMEFSGINLKLETAVEPAMPSRAKPYDAEQELFITIPEVSKIVFDPAACTPPGGRIQALARENLKVLDIPPSIDAKVQSRTMAPWGYHTLRLGDLETRLEYEVQITVKFSLLEEDDGGHELTAGVEVQFTGWLTGHGSAKFQPDGKPLEAPVR